MISMSVGELKARFSEMLQAVNNGEKVEVTYGRKKKVMAMMVPPDVPPLPKRKLGILKGKASFRYIGGHNTTEEEFFGKSLEEWLKDEAEMHPNG